MVKKRPCPLGAFYGQEATMPVGAFYGQEATMPVGAFYGQEAMRPVSPINSLHLPSKRPESQSARFRRVKSEVQVQPF